MIKLASEMPFRQAAKTLEETSGGILSHQMIYRILQTTGEAFDDSEKKITKSLIENGELPRSKNKQPTHLFVEADGAMISVQRNQHKKAEVKLVVAHEGWGEIAKDKWSLKNKTILAGLHLNKRYLG